MRRKTYGSCFFPGHKKETKQRKKIPCTHSGESIVFWGRAGRMHETGEDVCIKEWDDGARRRVHVCALDNINGVKKTDEAWSRAAWLPPLQICAQQGWNRVSSFCVCELRTEKLDCPLIMMHYSSLSRESCCSTGIMSPYMCYQRFWLWISQRQSLLYFLCIWCSYCRCQPHLLALRQIEMNVRAQKFHLSQPSLFCTTLFSRFIREFYSTHLWRPTFHFWKWNESDVHLYNIKIHIN